MAFDAKGKRTILDTAPSAQIPAASLSLNGSTVTRTNAGQTKAATIG